MDATETKTFARKTYIDTLKFFSIFIVYLTHFIDYWNNSYFKFWTEKPSSFLLYGISGKLGVAFFSVCVGYFAFLSKHKNPLVYMIRRYFYFFLCGFIINTIFAFGNHDISIKILTEAVKLGAEYFPAYWCMFSFFLASIVSYFNSYYKASLSFIILEIIIFGIIGYIWVSICLLGNITILILNNEKFMQYFQCKRNKIFLLVLCFFLIKRDESNMTYFIDGICSCIILCVVENSAQLKKILSCKLFLPGKNVMPIYLFHTFIFIKMGKYLFASFSDMPYSHAFLLTFILCWIVLLVISFPVDFVLQSIMKKVSQIINNFISDEMS